MDSYPFRQFDSSMIRPLFEAFIASFAGNSVSFNPSFQQFQNRIFHKLHIDHDRSGLIVNQYHKIEGFALYTTGNINGIVTAYNGGLGVIPDSRRKGLASRLMEKTLTGLADKGINKVSLEVITTNKPAIHLYESFGFGSRRHLKCFKVSRPIFHINQSLIIRESKTLKAAYQSFWDYEPTFLDTSSHLIHNLKYERILEAYVADQLVGYLIFQHKTGRISQIATHFNYRKFNVAKTLLTLAQEASANKHLTIMNVPEEQEATTIALEKLGFKNEVDQYEMELII